MNETEYELWKNEYYDNWLKDPTHDLHKYISFLNTDNNKFMCKVNFKNTLYIII